MIDPRYWHIARELLLEGDPCGSRLTLGAGLPHAREERVERGRVKIRVVQGAPCLTRIEHRADVRQREIAGNSGDEHFELLPRRASFGEKTTQLHLSDRNADAPRRQIGLDELLEGVIAAADRQQVDGERAAVADANTVWASTPTRRIEEGVGASRIMRRAGVERERIVGWYGSRGRRPVARECGAHDAIAVEGEIHGAPDAHVVEWGSVGIQDQSDTEQDRVIEH